MPSASLVVFRGFAGWLVLALEFLLAADILRSEFPAPKSAGDLVGLLAQTIVEVRSGLLEPRVANSLSYVAAAFMSALETADLDTRLRALENSVPRGYEACDADGKPTIQSDLPALDW